MIRRTRLTRVFTMLLIALMACFSSAQEPGPARAPRTGPPRVNSPEVASDRRISFRLFAPKAQVAQLSSSDLAEVGQGREMVKGDDGVWEVTLGPIDSGAYRYRFDLDGVPVMDPSNPSTSESNGNSWSLLYVPGSDWMDTRDVPHGAVSEVTYYSKSLNRFRRLHVYTPPGYESGSDTYPVFYLLHGALDCDDSWTTVGRAGFILDNLLAEQKATPMVVVMPAGHTSPFRFGSRGGGLRMDEFAQDFVKDIMPLVESRYRIQADREHRALAGLSMGGAQTLDVAISNLDQFAYVGVFSSGVFGISGGGRQSPDQPSWEVRHVEALDNAELKQGLRLVWFATGRDDFLLETSRATVEMLKKHDFEVVYRETPGGHTWVNWREYLRKFSPQLFRMNETDVSANRSASGEPAVSVERDLD